VNLELLLHFLKFDIQTNTLDIKPWIDRLYVSNDLTKTFPDKCSSLKLMVENKNSPEAALICPPAKGVFAETNLCTGRCYFQNGRFFSANHGDYWHEMEYDLSTHTIRANVAGKYLYNNQALISHLIRPILQSFILPFYGIKTLHGAVLTKAGRTIFLSGQGGVGKTTSAVQLMRAGFDLLSEDGPLFITNNGSAYALSSLDFLHVTENTLMLFPELKPFVVGQKDHREKFAVSMSNLQNGCSWTQPQRITDYIQLQRCSNVNVPHLKQTNRSVVHRELINESMVVFRWASFRQHANALNGYSEFVFDLLTKVIHGAETYELKYGDQHLEQIPDLISQL
jgi:hypothetical protein